VVRGQGRLFVNKFSGILEDRDFAVSTFAFTDGRTDSHAATLNVYLQEAWDTNGNEREADQVTDCLSVERLRSVSHVVTLLMLLRQSTHASLLTSSSHFAL